MYYREDLIKIYALSNKYYSEEINNGYFIPTNIFKPDGSEINLSSNRQSALLNNSSSYSNNFENDIKNLSSEINPEFISYLKEFPIILDKLVWEELLKDENVSKDRTDLWCKNYILLDYFFPKARVIYEIDSSFHKDRLVYDRLRDKYVRVKYGLDTIRLYEYGKDPISHSKLLKNLKKELYSRYNLYSNSNRIIIDQSDIILNNFIRKNNVILGFISKIFRYTGRYIKGGIALTDKDIYNIDPYNLGVFTLSDQYKLFTTNIVNLMKSIYNIRLYIHSSNQYTIFDVIWAISKKDDPMRWTYLDSKNIPIWITKIFGKPTTKELGNYKISNNNDDNIESLLDKIRIFGY